MNLILLQSGICVWHEYLTIHQNFIFLQLINNDEWFLQYIQCHQSFFAFLITDQSIYQPKNLEILIR